MAYVSEYEHDIFVSYAHDDDQPTNVSTVGWITTLIKNLEVELNRRVGPAKVSIWTDHRLAGNVPSIRSSWMRSARPPHFWSSCPPRILRSRLVHAGNVNRFFGS
jgi:hypothetical protein